MGLRDQMFLLVMGLIAILLAWLHNTRIPMPPTYLRTMQIVLGVILLGFLYLYLAGPFV